MELRGYDFPVLWDDGDGDIGKYGLSWPKPGFLDREGQNGIRLRRDPGQLGPGSGWMVEAVLGGVRSRGEGRGKRRRTRCVIATNF